VPHLTRNISLDAISSAMALSAFPCARSATLAGRRPVKVARLIEVVPVRTKSSADSISNFPAVDSRVAVANFPSGTPVLKKNESNPAGIAYSKPINVIGVASFA
jgi:hypothetical protein